MLMGAMKPLIRDGRDHLTLSCAGQNNYQRADLVLYVPESIGQLNLQPHAPKPGSLPAKGRKMSADELSEYAGQRPGKFLCFGWTSNSGVPRGYGLSADFARTA
jgi:hypothetical protein